MERFLRRPVVAEVGGEEVTLLPPLLEALLGENGGRDEVAFSWTTTAKLADFFMREACLVALVVLVVVVVVVVVVVALSLWTKEEMPIFAGCPSQDKSVPEEDDGASPTNVVTAADFFFLPGVNLLAAAMDFAEEEETNRGNVDNEVGDKVMQELEAAEWKAVAAVDEEAEEEEEEEEDDDK